MGPGYYILKGLKPETYRERVEVRESIANIDYNKLPSHLLQRIVDGEHPLSVLASVEPIAIDSGQPQPGTD